MNVVPYNPYILLAWGGHVNVQKITRSCLKFFVLLKLVQNYTVLFSETIMFARVLLMT